MIKAPKERKKTTNHSKNARSPKKKKKAQNDEKIEKSKPIPDRKKNDGDKHITELNRIGEITTRTNIESNSTTVTTRRRSKISDYGRR